MRMRLHLLALLLLLQSCNLFAPVDPLLPIVSTDAASNVQATSFTLQGSISDPSFKNARQEKKSGAIVEYGFILRRGSGSDTIKKGSSLSSSPLTFEHTFTGLAGNTKYSAEAYAKNEGGGFAQGTAVEVTTGVPIPTSGVFIHKVAAATTASILDDPGLNSNPNAIIMLTANYTASAVYSPSPLAVRYVSGRWSVVNQNGSSLPANVSCNIYYTAPSKTAFRHTATTGNTYLGTSVYLTTLDHPLLNDKPDAKLLATKVRGTSAANSSSFGLFYTDGRWRIYQQTVGQNILPGTEFNIIIDDRVFSTRATAANISSNNFYITPNLNNAKLRVFVSNLWSGVYNTSEVGVWLNIGKWYVFNQTRTAMPVNCSYFVLAL